MKAEQVKDLLDDEIFTCNKCGGKFNHTQGTWLPIGIEKKNPISDTGVQYPSVLIMDLRPPEIVTSNEFTCYGCANWKCTKYLGDRYTTSELKGSKVVVIGRLLRKLNHLPSKD